MEACDEVKDKRQHDAEQNAGADGEEERNMLAAISEVAGQSAERQAEARGKHDERPDKDDEKSDA